MNHAQHEWQPFKGRYVDQMQILLARGLVPISVAEIMQQRIAAFERADKSKRWFELREFWLINNFDSGDAVVISPKRKTVKVVLDAKLLRETTPGQLSSLGDMVVGEDQYRAIEGMELSRAEADRYRTGFYEQDVVNNPVWLTLARDRAVLKEYARVTFHIENRYGHPSSMNLNITGSTYETAGELREGVIGTCGNYSQVCASRLIYSESLLIGVAPRQSRERDAARGLEEVLRA